MYPRLDVCILEELFRAGVLSIETLIDRLAQRRTTSITTALGYLLLNGQVQRVGASNHFRLSPTQVAMMQGFTK